MTIRVHVSGSAGWGTPRLRGRGKRPGNLGGQKNRVDPIADV